MEVKANPASCCDLAGRVVVLSADSRLADELTRQLAGCAECVSITSPYEAGAEILALPADVLVVELRLMRNAHDGLLNLCRRKNTDIIAFGAISAGTSSEDLSGVLLAGRAELAELIREILSRRGGQETYASQKRTTPKKTIQLPPPTETTQSDSKSAEIGQYQPTDSQTQDPDGNGPGPFDPQLSFQIPLSELELVEQNDSQSNPETPAPPRPAERTEKTQPKTPGRPAGHGLLSPEELDALLGDQ